MSDVKVLSEMSRRELYDAVWQTPVSKLALELGMSDVGLAKYCRRLEIPIPARGYWAKLAAGKYVKRTPLPYAREHALIAQTKIKLRTAAVDSRQFLYGPRGTFLDVRVTRRTLWRALRIFTVLIEQLEARGHRVEIRDSSRHWTYAIVFEDAIPVSVQEKVVEMDYIAKKNARPDVPERNYPYERWEFYPTGQIVLAAGEKTWTDGPAGTIEAQVPSVVDYLERIARAKQAKEAESKRLEAASAKLKGQNFEWALQWMNVETSLKLVRQVVQSQTLDDSERQELIGWLSWARPYLVPGAGVPEYHPPAENIPGWAWNKIRNR